MVGIAIADLRALLGDTELSLIVQGVTKKLWWVDLVKEVLEKFSDWLYGESRKQKVELRLIIVHPSDSVEEGMNGYAKAFYSVANSIKKGPPPGRVS